MKKKNWQKKHLILFSNNLVGSLYPIRTRIFKQKNHAQDNI
jgi:hypothetical protein